MLDPKLAGGNEILPFSNPSALTSTELFPLFSQLEGFKLRTAFGQIFFYEEYLKLNLCVQNISAQMVIKYHKGINDLKH